MDYTDVSSLRLSVFILFHSLALSHSFSTPSTPFSLPISSRSLFFSLSPPLPILYLFLSPPLSGFQVVSYPLMERGFESQDSRGTAAPLAVVAVAAAKSSSAQADSPLLPEGEWKSGSGSDRPPLGGGHPQLPGW